MMRPSVAILRTQTDERLVALAREGHEAAFTAIVERYRRPMLVACRRFLPEARAEDAVQQTFVAAWKGLRRGDEVRELRPWLYRIARNTALNALRTPGYDVTELQESLRVTEAPQDELERREAVRRTLAGLAALPERQREALLRTAVEGAAHADVARDLGLSEGATRQLVMRARTTLRSAASAVLPFPVLQWLVASGATAGAGGGAAAATLAKAGAVVVVAGSAVATPVVVVDRARDSEPRRVRAAPAAGAPAVAVAPTPDGTAARSDVADDLVIAGTRAEDDAADAGERRGRTRRRGRGGDDGAGDGGGERRSGPSGSGGSGSDSSGSGSSGSDDDEDDGDRSGSSGGAGDDDPDGDDSSGSGSGSGGGSDDSGVDGSPSDSSGSGSDSGSSGSGDSDEAVELDSSGSGSDGSGSSGSDDLRDADELEDDSSGSGSGHD